MQCICRSEIQEVKNATNKITHYMIKYIDCSEWFVQMFCDNRLPQGSLYYGNQVKAFHEAV